MFEAGEKKRRLSVTEGKGGRRWAAGWTTRGEEMKRVAVLLRICTTRGTPVRRGGEEGRESIRREREEDNTGKIASVQDGEKESGRRRSGTRAREAEESEEGTQL